jgi:hypothetical protein
MAEKGIKTMTYYRKESAASKLTLSKDKSETTRVCRTISDNLNFRLLRFLLGIC